MYEYIHIIDIELFYLFLIVLLSFTSSDVVDYSGYKEMKGLVTAVRKGDRNDGKDFSYMNIKEILMCVFLQFWNAI